MKNMVSLCKRRGFIFPGSEIYGGLANTWDYGPVGVELKNNVKKEWWKTFVNDREDIVGIDSSILLNPKVWEASGHVGSFYDFLVDCKNCKERFRVDKLIEEELIKRNSSEIVATGWSVEKMKQTFIEYQIKCPNCQAQDFTEIRQFNLMFKTHQGVIEDSSTIVYLRPETAQGIFLNFKNILNSSRKKLPFGIGQIGKSFRNEITPGNFIFRTREFEQMEMEYFCSPKDSSKFFKYWKQFCMDWLLNLGIKQENLRFRDHTKEELSHYSSETVDIEYKFPFGWGELWGIANRGCYDLTQHQKYSGEDMSYHDTETNEKFIPHVIEPALGVDRLVLAILLDAYSEEIVRGETRVVLKFNKKIAPIKVAVLPLSKKEELIVKAKGVFDMIKCEFVSDFDITQSIGRRYRRQDEIGTPLCVTIDFDTLNDEAVTIRDRDTMDQIRVPISNLILTLKEKLKV